MERPGLLEFAVYALVLTAAAGWVYALPPFTHVVGTGSQSAEIQPGAATSSNDPASDRTEAVTEVSNQDSAAAQATQPQSAAPSEPDEQPRLDPQPNLLVVTARSLNMRSAPNARSELVGSYPRGALVKQVETNGNWVLVRTVDDDSTGWMYAGHLGAAENN